jgi:hypothetical protein
VNVKEPKLNTQKLKVKNLSVPNFQLAGRYVLKNLLDDANGYKPRHSVRDSGGGPIHIEGNSGSHYLNFY